MIKKDKDYYRFPVNETWNTMGKAMHSAAVRYVIMAVALVLLFETVQLQAATRFLGFREGEESTAVPEGWELITYWRTGRNEMILSREGKQTVLMVKSLGSASAIIKRLNADFKIFPILVWRWKINRTVGMAIEHLKDRNDAAARIRVIFKEDEEMNQTVELPDVRDFLRYFEFEIKGVEPWGPKIDYIWGNSAYKGKVIDYPGSRNHKVIFVESGNALANKWVWEKRDLLEDFRQCFGRTPAGLAGIVVLTDTDDTNEGVVAHYSSIVLISRE